MKDEDLNLFSSVLDDFAIAKTEIVKKLDNFNEVLDGFSDYKKVLADENEKTSFLFNPLRFFGIGETMHSFLVAKLLDPNGEHGQGNKFLNLFLKQIGIDHQEKDKWIVTAEKGRIDILIKRKYPKEAVIVIENKSNNAVDQKNQLYRYWLQEMFFPHKEKKWRHALGNKKSYRIIYLRPNDTKIPNDSSLAKPQNLYSKGLPSMLYLKDITLLSFNRDIVRWLEKCIKCVDKDNYRVNRKSWGELKKH